nr:unnamed protein product [Spirometra erinaceieuropaei]
MNALRRLLQRIRRPHYGRRLRRSVQNRTLGTDNIFESVQFIPADKPLAIDVFPVIQKPDLFYRSFAITVEEDPVFETAQLKDIDRDFTCEVHTTDPFDLSYYRIEGQEVIFEAVQPMAADKAVNADLHGAEYIVLATGVQLFRLLFGNGPDYRSD